MIDLASIAFIDFEASDLPPLGLPIEIGISTLSSDGKLEIWSSLFKPDVSWGMMYWSRDAQRFHGITQSQILNSPSLQEIASTIESLFEGRRIISDAPARDDIWLEEIWPQISSEKRPLVEGFDRLVLSSFHAMDAERILKRMSRSRSHHRAGPDSARLARAFDLQSL